MYQIFAEDAEEEVSFRKLQLHAQARRPGRRSKRFRTDKVPCIQVHFNLLI
jgi:hypothetical protein